MGPGVVDGGDAAADEAGRFARRGRTDPRPRLPLHDSGRWSSNGLLTPGRPWRSYLANATYHWYRLALLRGMAGMYRDMRFASSAET